MGGCCQQRVSLCAGLGTVLGSLREDFGVCARAMGSLGRSLCVGLGKWTLAAGRLLCVCPCVFLCDGNSVLGRGSLRVS